MFHAIPYTLAAWFALSYGLLALILLITWMGRTRRPSCLQNEEPTTPCANS